MNGHSFFNAFKGVIMIKDFFENKLREHLNDNEELVEDIDATYLFNVTDNGSWFIDLTQFPPVIKEEVAQADCTIGISADDLMAIANKELDGMSAFMQGKLKIEGDMGLSLKLQSLLDFD
jgi:putative sterol carrier protein